MQLTEIEQAFKELKHDVAIRPIFHQREERTEAHIFVSFIAYCLLVTLLCSGASPSASSRRAGSPSPRPCAISPKTRVASSTSSK